METKLKASEETAILMEKAATHAGLLLDSVLFAPPNTTTPNDVFAFLDTNHHAWNATKSNRAPVVSQVMRSCTLELSLDYCGRLSTHVTNGYLDEMANETDFQAWQKLKHYCNIALPRGNPIVACLTNASNKTSSPKNVVRNHVPIKNKWHVATSMHKYK